MTRLKRSGGSIVQFVRIGKCRGRRKCRARRYICKGCGRVDRVANCSRRDTFMAHIVIITPANPINAAPTIRVKGLTTHTPVRTGTGAVHSWRLLPEGVCARLGWPGDTAIQWAKTRICRAWGRRPDTHRTDTSMLIARARAIGIDW